MVTKDQVLALFSRAPKATSTEIAEQLGCHSAYVRATLRRAGINRRRSLKQLREAEQRALEKIEALKKGLTATRREIASRTLRRAA